jgi:hypothetical protein
MKIDQCKIELARGMFTPDGHSCNIPIATIELYLFLSDI